MAAIRGRLAGPALESVAAAHLARRVIPADPTTVQHVVGIELTWWGRQRGKQRTVVDRLAALEWPVPLKRKFRAQDDARLV